MTLTREAEPLLLRPDEAAELLNVSRSEVYAMVAAGKLPAVRLTGAVRIPRAALIEMVESAIHWPQALVR